MTTQRSILRANIRDRTHANRLRSSAVHSHAATACSSSTRGTVMMTFSSRATATAVASLLLMSSALAQTTTPATPAPTAKTAPAAKATPAEKKAEKPRTAASLQCSKDADAKGLHGKERKKFMSECKKAAAEKPK